MYYLVLYIGGKVKSNIISFSCCTFYYTAVCSMYMVGGLWVDGFIRVVGGYVIIYSSIIQR